MIKIKDKKDSIFKMKELRLNYFPLDCFNVSDLKGIENFIKNNPAKEYILRNTSEVKGDFFFVKDFEEARAKLSNFSNEVTISVSNKEYKEDIILVGDIIIHDDFGVQSVDLTARSDSEATQRNIYEKPQYNFHTSMEDEKLWKVPGIAKIMRYISDHELYNVIIEFTVYDCAVGVKKENVVISELRTGF